MSKDLEVLKTEVKKLMLKDWTKTEVTKLAEFMEDVIIATMLVNKLPIHDVVRQSEQLNAFVDFYNNRKLSHERINYDEIEMFLESI